MEFNLVKIDIAQKSTVLRVILYICFKVIFTYGLSNNILCIWCGVTVFLYL